MHENQIISYLNKHYKTLNEPDLVNGIAQYGQLHTFEAGQVIMDFGDYVRLVPLIVEGSIKVLREDEEGLHELLLYYLNPGDTCSMSFSCCMMQKRSDIRTIAEMDSTIIGLPIQKVDEWMMRFPSWKNFVMRSYDNRMRELIHAIDQVAFHKLDERLLHYLEQKSAANNHAIIETTHIEIAHDLNTSRETVTRLLKKLEKLNKIRQSRHKIELL